MKKEILSWVKTIILAVLLAFVVDTVFIVNATVPTGSMENTIMAGDRILALRTSYWFSDPERGDVVVFEDPDDPTGKTLMSNASSALAAIPWKYRTVKCWSMARCRMNLISKKLQRVISGLIMCRKAVIS